MARNLLFLFLFFLEFGWIFAEVERGIELDICSLDDAVLDSGSVLGIYCNCRREDELFCGCWANPPEKYRNSIWSAMVKLQNTAYIELRIRPERSFKLLPPPQTFEELKRLSHFDIKSAQLNSIPENAFGNSSSLSTVKLQDNFIRILELESFSNLEQLTEIHLGSNEIEEVRRGVFTNLPNLQRLFLDRNKIQIVHDNAFKELENLKELDLKENNISVLTKEMFDGLRKLSRLELGGNSIEYLGAFVFANMPLLKDLYLHKNKIRSINPAALHHLHHLQRLDLKENSIIELGAPVSSHSIMLYYLDLRSNAMEGFPEETVEPIYNNLKNVSMHFFIEGNRFSCNCGILWMHKLYRETASTYVRENLEKIQCEWLKTEDDEGHHGHHHRLTYAAAANLTPSSSALLESSTAYALDSMKNVIKLNPEEFKCTRDTDNNNEIKKESRLASQDQNQKNGNEHHPSHHQSHVAPYQHTSGSNEGIVRLRVSVFLVSLLISLSFFTI